MAGLPLVYLHGKRVGLRQAHLRARDAVQGPGAADLRHRPCPACSLPIDCEIELRRSFTGGVPKISATVDATDFEHHTLTHVDEVQHP